MVHFTAVKSFLERFGEKCQERTNQSSAAGSTANDKILTVTPSVTPNTRLVQERLRAAQAANTATADLTQRQKLVGYSYYSVSYCCNDFLSDRFLKTKNSFQERESELAQIRSRFQKGSNMWKNKEEATEANKNTDIKVGQQASDTWQKCLTSHKNVMLSYICKIILNKLNIVHLRNRFTSLWKLKLPLWSHRMKPQHLLLRVQLHPKSALLKVFDIYLGVVMTVECRLFSVWMFLSDEVLTLAAIVLS